MYFFLEEPVVEGLGVVGGLSLAVRGHAEYATLALLHLAAGVRVAQVDHRGDEPVRLAFLRQDLRELGRVALLRPEVDLDRHQLLDWARLRNDPRLLV